MSEIMKNYARIYVNPGHSASINVSNKRATYTVDDDGVVWRHDRFGVAHKVYDPAEDGDFDS